MWLIALKRLWHRPWLTALSMVSIALAVALLNSLPLFARAVSFRLLKDELAELSAQLERPLFSMRVYYQPSGTPLSLEQCATLGQHLQTTIVAQVGRPLRQYTWHVESTGLVLRPGEQADQFGSPRTIIADGINLIVMPGVADRLSTVEGVRPTFGRRRKPYLPPRYVEVDGPPVVIGNLDHLFEQVGTPVATGIWLKLAPDADRQVVFDRVESKGVQVDDYRDARAELAQAQARVERVGIMGTLTIGFVAAAALSGLGLLIYNYASLQERLFRFTILRAVGLAQSQVVGAVLIEYSVLLLYGVFCGAAIGVLASRLFIPFFQAADRGVLHPPTLIPLVAWREIGWISGLFAAVLVSAQAAVLWTALRQGVFQALRLGDRE